MNLPKRAALALAIGLILPGLPAAADGPAGAAAELIATAPEVDSITEPELAAHLRFLSSDLMKGRDTASPEIRIASEYLATRLEMFGAEPAGDPEDGAPTYFAHFPLQFNTPKAEGTTLTITIDAAEEGGEPTVLMPALNEGFVLFPRGLNPGTIEAPVVFAGYGRSGDGDEPDDFEGLDVEGKLVLVLDGSPIDQDAEGLQERRRRGFSSSAFAKLRAAQEHGAAGLLVVHAFDAESDPYRETNAFAARMFDRPSMTLGEGGEQEGGSPVIFLEDDLRDAIADASGLDAGAEPRPLEGVAARFEFAAEQEVVRERNVIGLFPGSDDELKHEVVIFSAHYDHVGVGSDGQIYNGSDDNGSGTSALLEIAEAIGEGPRPRRSVAFLWVSGEEKGLLGSRWWADHVTLPEGSEIVADINMDMVSRNDSHKVSATPSPEHPDYSTLITGAEAAAKLAGMELVYDADEFYARTDSHSFAQKGIPIVFFFSGVHEDYHQPGDDYAKADLGKAVRIARMAYMLGWATANLDERPARIEAEPEAEAEEATEIDF